VRDLLPTPFSMTTYALATSGALERLMAQAGLRVHGGEVVAYQSVYPDAETAARAQMSAGPLQAALRVVGEQALRAAVQRALSPYCSGDGSVRLHHRHRYVIAAPDADADSADRHATATLV